MSLTSLLSGSPELRALLRSEFPKPSVVRSTPLLVARRGVVSSWVGTGFDYLMRWSLRTRFSRFHERQRWVAETVWEHLANRRTRLARTIHTRILSARRRVERYRRTGQLTDGLCRSAIELAQIDPLFRAGVGAAHILRPVSNVYARELRDLCSIVPWSLFSPRRAGWLNPTFSASPLVFGADADVVVDDMLVEIKTSVDSRVYREHFNQVLGYYLLFLLGGIEEAPTGHVLKRLAVYQSRQGRLIIWNVSDIAPPEVFGRAASRLERIARDVFAWRQDEDLRSGRGRRRHASSTVVRGGRGNKA